MNESGALPIVGQREKQTGSVVSKREQLAGLRKLIRAQRWAALATLDAEGAPENAMVAYAANERMDTLYLHLSELASHTRNLLRNPHVAIVISESDSGSGDPQQLVRASLSGHIEIVRPDAAAYAEIRSCYLDRLPDARMLFDFGDFHLFRLQVTRLRYVGGFGSAASFRPEQLLED